MLSSLLLGIPTMIVCLVLQAIFASLTLQSCRWLVNQRKSPFGHPGRIGLLSLVMLMMLLGNFLQMLIWAGLFRLLGEFTSFSEALYFSGVTFSTLGYGDLVLTPEWRILAPLEAANGILMFGVSTAMMTMAVTEAIKAGQARD